MSSLIPTRLAATVRPATVAAAPRPVSTRRLVVAAVGLFALAACNQGGSSSSPSASASGSGGSAGSASPSASPAAASPSAEPSSAASAAPSGELDQAVVVLDEQNGSGYFGGAYVTGLEGGETSVTVGLVAVGATEPLPASIHLGTCDDLQDEAAFELADVIAGASNTIVATDLDALLAEPHAIAVRNPASELVACGPIEG